MQVLMLQKTNPAGSITFVPAETVQTSDAKEAVVVGISDMPDREIIDVNANGSTYYGTAPWGSATSDAVWVIERETSNRWVTSAPNQVWDDRLTVIYNNGVA